MIERKIPSEEPARLSPRAPFYRGETFTFDEIPIHLDKFNWVFYPEGQRREIPVYSIWNYDQHDEIANKIAQGEAAAMYMWGTYGVGMLLDSPMWQVQNEEESGILRNHLKKGRPWSQQFANFMHPDDMVDFWDIDRFHKKYRDLQWAKNRWGLYQSGPIHIIAPTKESNPYLDLSLVRKSDGTGSYFYMPHPAYNHLIEEIRIQVKHSSFGGGSMNPHQELPPFSTLGLYNMLKQNEDWQKHVGLVIIDEPSEYDGIFRGGTMVRIPQIGFEEHVHLVRRGSLDAEGWAARLGYQIKDAPEGIREASSIKTYSDNENRIIDEKVRKRVEKMEKLHNLISAGNIK